MRGSRRTLCQLDRCGGDLPSQRLSSAISPPPPPEEMDGAGCRTGQEGRSARSVPLSPLPRAHSNSTRLYRRQAVMRSERHVIVRSCASGHTRADYLQFDLPLQEAAPASGRVGRFEPKADAKVLTNRTVLNHLLGQVTGIISWHNALHSVPDYRRSNWNFEL